MVGPTINILPRYMREELQNAEQSRKWSNWGINRCKDRFMSMVTEEIESNGHFRGDLGSFFCAFFFLNKSKFCN
jgi:hypothetical protein